MPDFDFFGRRHQGPGGPEIQVSFERQRRDMVQKQLASRGISDAGVLGAMSRVPRHEFLHTTFRHAAYEDRALPLGEGETLSQPFIVALTLQSLQLQPGAHVLDVGSGTGYQSAVLSEMGCVVWAIEINPALADSSRARLARLGFGQVTVTSGDGSFGWAVHAPFDGTAVAAASAEIPEALLRQMRDGGRLVAPVGGAEEQMLTRVTRRGEGYQHEAVAPVRFVPLKRAG